VEGNDHGALGRKMAFVDRVGDVFLDTDEAEVRGRVGVLDGGVPFVGVGHSHGDGIAGVDLDVHVAASGSGTVDAGTVQAGGLERNGLAVGRSPVENAIVLRARNGGEGADEQREKD